MIAVATALAILALAMTLFLNSAWVGFEQGRAQAAAWTGFTPADLRTATDSILADLIIGPPDFDVVVAGRAVLSERERSHMRDVRGVFVGFFGVTLVVILVAAAFARRRPSGRALWAPVRTGAVGLIVGLVVVGVISFVAFDTLFEVFHRVFFAGGSYTFDPARERLVQLFPFAFWQETAIALGAVSIVIAAVLAVVAGRRASAGVDRHRSIPAEFAARIPRTVE